MAVNAIVDVCDSTNDLARKLGQEGAPQGTWISARQQLKGRGRLGREWLSYPDNLFLSMIVRPGSQKGTTWIPLAAGVGVCRGLQKLYPGISVGLKWPNDLWIGKAKAGGLLCEAVQGAGGTFVIVGLGLNCATDPQTELTEFEQNTTSLSKALGKRVTADQIREEVVASLVSSFEVLQSAGSLPIAQAYQELAVLRVGTKIFWGEGAHSGVVIGLGAAGELKVKSIGDSKEISLYAEDVKVRASG